MPPKGKGKGKAKSKQSHRKNTASTSTAVSGRVFPREVIFHILSGLPVKTLLRFKCVCKQWRTLISLPAFTSAHLSRSPASLIIHAFKAPDPPKIPAQADGHIIYTYGPPNWQMSRHSTIDSLPVFPGSDAVGFEYLEVVGSANGLVLIAHRPSYFTEFTLWNPATRSSLNIPFSESSYSPFFHAGESAGLGFAPSLNEYKIIRILCYPTPLETRPDSAEVFNFKTGRWTTLLDNSKNNNNNNERPGGPARRFRVVRTACEAVVKGVPYWRALKDDVNLGITRTMLLSFDVKKMVFDLEPFGWSLNNKEMFMGEIKDGCLGAIVWDVTAEGALPVDEDRVLDVWMKQEDQERRGWSRIYRVSDQGRLVLGWVAGFYCRPGGGDCRSTSGLVQEVVGEEGKNYLWLINLDEDQNKMEMEDFFYLDYSWPRTFKLVGYNPSFTRIPKIGNALIP